MPSLLRAPPLLALFSLLETGFVPVVLLASSQEGSFGLGLGLGLRVGLVCLLWRCVGWGFLGLARPLALASSLLTGCFLLGDGTPAFALCLPRVFVCQSLWHVSGMLALPLLGLWVGLGCLLGFFWGFCCCGLTAGPAFGFFDRQLQSLGDCIALQWNLPPVKLFGKDLSVACLLSCWFCCLFRFFLGPFLSASRDGS